MRRPNLTKLIRSMLTRGWMRDGANYRYALTEECEGKSHLVHLAKGLRTFSTADIRWVREFLDEKTLEDWPLVLLKLKAENEDNRSYFFGRDNVYLCIKVLEAYFGR